MRRGGLVGGGIGERVVCNVFWVDGNGIGG